MPQPMHASASTFSQRNLNLANFACYFLNLEAKCTPKNANEFGGKIQRVGLKLELAKDTKTLLFNTVAWKFPSHIGTDESK